MHADQRQLAVSTPNTQAIQALATSDAPLPPTPVRALARVQGAQVQYVDEQRLAHRTGYIFKA